MSPRVAACPTIVLTIGHSTRSLKELLELLEAHGVEQLADVRTIPRSRHNPQFNRESLAGKLRRAGIGYTHMPALGGLRHPRPDSPNQGWRNASFRGFADYMQTPEFGAGIVALIDAAVSARTFAAGASGPSLSRRRLRGIFFLFGFSRASKKGCRCRWTAAYSSSSSDAESWPV